MNWLWLAKSVAVFVSMGAADICWTRYMQRVASKEPVVAGMWSAGIVAIGAVSVMAYVNDPLYLIPAGLGAFVGTWWSVRT